MNEFHPGMFVLHPAEPGWGLGRVQTVVGDKVTVNFENEGKVVLDVTKVDLEITFPDGR